MDIGVLASGNGTTFEYLCQCYKEGALDTDNENRIVVLICNNPDALVVQRAKINGIPVEIINHRDYKTREAFDTDVASKLIDYKVQVVAMAGWMRIASAPLVNCFKDRVVNIHPSLLPAFKGTNAPQQAIDAGVLYSGCTAHIVNEELDAGPILAQHVVSVYGDDTAESLHSRIKEYEGAILQDALIILIEEIECSQETK